VFVAIRYSHERSELLPSNRRMPRHAQPVWLPYVEVTDIAEITERARGLGAAVLLEPREGPAGWRSVVAAPAGGDVAFWQPKGHCPRRDLDARAMSSGSSAGLTGKLHRTRRRTT
jgi:hypothetical protein